MPNYNEAQGVADLLSQFDFNIINEGPGDFSTQHRKYTCEFSKPGIESFTTTYQSNPDVHGQPTATDVFAALASDALAVGWLTRRYLRRRTRFREAVSGHSRLRVLP